VGGLDVGCSWPWVRRLQEHDEPALEGASEQLGTQLELRRSVLEEQISGVDRHRTVLVDELHAVAEDGMKLRRQASNLSKLPDHVPGIGGAHFLRIQTQEPDDPSEKRARLAELIDELLAAFGIFHSCAAMNDSHPGGMSSSRATDMA
jgi:hypothetical protein